MLIHEVSNNTGLTKKAIEYYVEQGLVFPTILENGYRDFGVQDIDRLQKISILRKLGSGAAYADIGTEVKALEDNATIAEKLLESFPGYYGRFICLHFVRFLNEPVVTDEQRSAYGIVISFLDGVSALNLLDEEVSQVGVDETLEWIMLERFFRDPEGAMSAFLDG